MFFKKSKTATKYKAVKTDGYDSKRESQVAKRLHEQEDKGEIKDLQEQVRFELLAKQKDKDGKVAYRAVNYIADFCYYDKEGIYHVVDVKGMKTPVFALKEKLFFNRYGYKIEIVK